MKKLIGFVFAAVLAVAAAPAEAQKNATEVRGDKLLPASSVMNAWTDILTASLHTSQQKDLVIGVSLETGLLTDTTVVSSKLVKSTADAEAMIEVQVLLDGQVVASPGIVTFDRRKQSLMAKFAGYMDCTDLNDDDIINYSECTWTDEELQLILDTLAAHAFNFVLTNVGVGDHTVTVQARITTPADGNTTTNGGISAASAHIGKGSVTVEEVRYANSFQL